MLSSVITRYQVFLSSTYDDLREERKAVLDALLEADFIPVGMEMFGAASVPSWDVITKTIDISDFYVLIVGFRYGSLLDGISYTEREYDYAVKKGVPILTFIRDREAPVSTKKRESDPDSARKLDDFIKRVSSKQCAYWTTDSDLKLKIIQSLSKEKMTTRPGWYRFLAERTTTYASGQHFIFISASPNPQYSTEKMLETVRNQEDLPFREDLKRDERVHQLDIAKDFGKEGQRLESVTEQHIRPIKKYLMDKMANIGSAKEIALFYAGPVGLAFHIGCLFTNGPTPQVYQFSSGRYVPLGVIGKMC